MSLKLSAVVQYYRRVTSFDGPDDSQGEEGQRGSGGGRLRRAAEVFAWVCLFRKLRHLHSHVEGSFFQPPALRLPT